MFVHDQWSGNENTPPHLSVAGVTVSSELSVNVVLALVKLKRLKLSSISSRSDGTGVSGLVLRAVDGCSRAFSFSRPPRSDVDSPGIAVSLALSVSSHGDQMYRPLSVRHQSLKDSVAVGSHLRSLTGVQMELALPSRLL